MISKFPAACFFCLCALLSLTAKSQAAEQIRGITARGTCLRSVAQDRGSLTLTTSVLSNNASESSSRATTAHQKLRAEIQNLKLEKVSIQTTDVSIGEEFEWSHNKQQSKGFRARISISIETSEINRLGEVVALAAKHGIKELGQLRTFVSNDKYKAEYENCIEIAAQNARDKAQKLAKGAGIKLGRVLVLEEGNIPAEAAPVQVMSKAMFESASLGAGSSAPSIDTRVTEIGVSVLATFESN